MSLSALQPASRRDFLRCAGGLAGASLRAQPARRPNFIVILADDQGYADLGCYGSPDIRTPAIDRLAAEGMRFTSFYAQIFCGPSRAALMTGCYPPRVNCDFNHNPKAKTGLNPRETTIASALKPLGYSTMIAGKWHLGDHPAFLPSHYGFDRFFGTPYSNDMWPYHPRSWRVENEHPRLTAARERAAYTGYAGAATHYPKDGGFPDLPLLSNGEVVDINPDQTKLTSAYISKSLEFIRENREKPFLLYLAHNMPHVPLFTGRGFQARSRRGKYGDAIEEIDDGVRQIAELLRELRLERDTMIVYTSDNGPWLEYGIDGGSAGSFRNGKGTHWEGGFRVPGIFHWPGRIPAGQISSDITANIDLLPTIAASAGAKLDSSRAIDGLDLSTHLHGAARSPRDDFYFFRGRQPGTAPVLAAVRSREWKLHFASESGALRPSALYHLLEDPGERFDRLAGQSKLAAAMTGAAQAFYDDLVRNARPLGRLPG